MTTATPGRKSRGRRLYTADTPRTCGRCRQEIPAGAEHLRDTSGTAQHPACHRFRVTVAPLEAPRPPAVIVLKPSPAPCQGCGDETAGEPTLHVNGRPWHRECRRLEVHRT